MAERPAFQDKQYAFAAHIRDPHHTAAPSGIEDRRMAIYRDLFFNNLLSLISSTFPVLTRLYPDARWRRLVRQFMVHHHAETPYFLKIPEEFIKFLKIHYVPRDDDLPFLIELAHYEWAELALSVSDASDDFDSVDAQGNLLDGIPVKSKLAWSLVYQFPVHRINRSFQPQKPGEQPTFLVVYRKPDDELAFMELNPVTARLLELIDGNKAGHSGRELLLSLAAEINYADTEALVSHGAAAMQDMHNAGFLLGARRAQ